MTISERISSYAKERGIKQNTIAEVCGVTAATVSMWLKSNAESIPSSYIIPLARLFGVTPIELLTGERYLAGTQGDEAQRLVDMYDQLEWDGKHIVMASAVQECRRLEIMRERAKQC